MISPGKPGLPFSSSFGLGSKLIFFTTGLILSVVSILACYFTVVERDLLRDELRNRALSLARNFVHNCGYPLLLEDLSAINKLADGIMSEEDAVRVSVRNLEGKEVFQISRDAGSAPADAKYEEFLSWSEPGAPRLWESANVLIISLPVQRPLAEDLAMGEGARHGADGRIIGSAALGFSLERTNHLHGSVGRPSARDAGDRIGECFLSGRRPQRR